MAVACLTGSLLAGATAAAAAQDAVPVPLDERSRGAERIIVGRVAAVAPEWQVNEFGDRLIVSIVRVAISETIKGPSEPTTDVRVEGGTIGDLTLRVSDQEPLAQGDRAVFYLRRTVRGGFVPHLRGQGVLKLDASDRVPGTSLTLAIVRREAAAAR